jgi:hypothetical protein
MEERRKFTAFRYHSIIRDLIGELRHPELYKDHNIYTFKTTLINRAFRANVYGISKAIFEDSNGIFIWWDFELGNDMFEQLNAAYITGNPIQVNYVKIEKDNSNDILIVKAEVEKYNGT